MNDQKDDPVGAALGRFCATLPSGPLRVESVGLLNCCGKVLAADICAAIDLPPFSRALVEGYLINVTDTEAAGDNNPVMLAIRGTIAPGKVYPTQLPAGTCMEVSTGSFIPEGAYAVIRYMDVARSDGRIAVKRRYPKGDSIEGMGCEIKKGDLMLRAGTRLSPKEIMILAGQGILSVEVAGRPRVAIFCSGNEVIPPSEPLMPGHVWDANSYTLSAQIEEYGGLPLFCGIMKDDLFTFQRALGDGLAKADMAVISGGTAVGGKEFIVELINSLGRPGVVVNGVPMRSGKPLIMGIIEGKPIVCVAGYPPESMRGFELFGKPTIEKLLGQSLPPPL